MRFVFVCLCLFFFFNDTATTEIYTLSLHDALPISTYFFRSGSCRRGWWRRSRWRSEEHTSELQSRVDISYAVFCLKKKIKAPTPTVLYVHHLDFVTLLVFSHS